MQNISIFLGSLDEDQKQSFYEAISRAFEIDIDNDRISALLEILKTRKVIMAFRSEVFYANTSLDQLGYMEYQLQKERSLEENEREEIIRIANKSYLIKYNKYYDFQLIEFIRLKHLNAYLENINNEMAKMSTIANNTPGLYKISNINNYYYYFNLNYKLFSGIQDDSELAIKWFDLIDLKDRHTIINLMNKNYKKRSRFKLEYTMHGKDILNREFEDNIEPYFDSNHFFLGYVSSAFDVTDEKHSKALIKNYEIDHAVSSALLSSFEGSNTPIFAVDENDCIYFYNKTFKALFDSDVLLNGQLIFSVFSISKKANVSLIARMSEFNENNIPVKIKYSHSHNNLRSQILNMNLIYVQIVSGRKVGFVSCINIEQEKLAVENIKFQDHNYQLILNNLEDLYFKISKKFDIIELNSAVQNMLGYEVQGLIGENVLQYIIQPPKKDIKNIVSKGRYGTKVIIKMSTRLGEIKFIECKLQFALDPILKKIVILGLGRDVSNIILTQKQLVNKNKSIQKLLRAKQMFLANMSHEVRTPLNGIIGLTEVLLNSNLSDESYSIIQLIKSSGDQLMHIVNDILDISKIEAGKFSISPSDFSFNELIQEIELEIRPLFDKKNLNLFINIKTDNRNHIFLDRFRLKQIIQNLLSNALKFTESGSVLLSSEIFNNNLRLSVKDTGIGIPNEKLSNLFKPFSQIDNSLSKLSQGTGLGLYIIKTIVEQMDGTITVNSQIEIGSEFIIEIPFTYPIKDILSKAEGEYMDKKSHLINDVMIVDDNSTNQKVVVEILNVLHISSLVCSSAISLIANLTFHDINLILLDIQMPEFDGIETLKFLKTCKLFEGPVIALTAYSLEGDRQKFISSGFDSYISKPLTKKSLEQSLFNINPLQNISSSSYFQQSQLTIFEGVVSEYE